MEGGCTCRQVRYRLIGTPLIVHACHCRWCQRETGTAHALNTLYEADRLVHTAAEPEIVVMPSHRADDRRNRGSTAGLAHQQSGGRDMENEKNWPAVLALADRLHRVGDLSGLEAAQVVAATNAISRPYPKNTRGGRPAQETEATRVKEAQAHRGLRGARRYRD